MAVAGAKEIAILHFYDKHSIFDFDETGGRARPGASQGAPVCRQATPRMQ